MRIHSKFDWQTAYEDGKANSRQFSFEWFVFMGYVFSEGYLTLECLAHGVDEMGIRDMKNCLDKLWFLLIASFQLIGFCNIIGFPRMHFGTFAWKICFCFVFFLSVPLESVNWLSNIFGVPSSLRDLFITYSACHAHVHIQWTHNLLACLNQYCVRRRFSLWVHIPRILSAISIRMCRSSGRISQKKQRK